MRRNFILTVTFLLFLILLGLSQKNDIKLYKFQQRTAEGRFFGLINTIGEVTSHIQNVGNKMLQTKTLFLLRNENEQKIY